MSFLWDDLTNLDAGLTQVPIVCAYRTLPLMQLGHPDMLKPRTGHPRYILGITPLSLDSDGDRGKYPVSTLGTVHKPPVACLWLLAAYIASQLSVSYTTCVSE